MDPTNPTSDTRNAAGLSAAQLDELKQRLLDTRQELLARRSAQLDARGQGMAEVEDEGDIAARSEDESTLLRLAESERQRLEEIQHALSKFESGEYGLDEDTDEPIAFERLQLVPWARFAASTQERRERRG